LSWIELFLIAVGLSMDAFAVAVCKGLSMRRLSPPNMLIVGGYFGVFQAGMPLFGYLLASTFSDKITGFDHWIAFVLLVLIGGNMVRESLSKDEDGEDDGSLKIKEMLPLAVATSIDALAVGVTFAFLQVDIVSAVGLIGVVTFVLSVVGVKIGNLFGAKFKSKAEFLGGVVLVLMGAKILLEHMGIFG